MDLSDGGKVGWRFKAVHPDGRKYEAELAWAELMHMRKMYRRAGYIVTFARLPRLAT